MKKRKTVVVKNSSDRESAKSVASSSRFWRWGDDNLLPNALALLSRRSTVHRRIINDKADYIAGKGFVSDDTFLGEFVQRVNGSEESLRQIIYKLAFDKSLFGNAFLEVVTDTKRSFLSLYHQDASRCRIACDQKHIILHHNWAQFRHSEAKQLPIWPLMEEQSDGTMRSIVHYKDYEPQFAHYGIPPYIAGMDVSTIAYKTDNWNISRLDHSFQPSGVMMLDSELDSEQELNDLIRTAERKFSGKPGQVLFILKDDTEGDNSRFIPITSQNEGDWRELHDQAVGDIVVAHSWFRSLSGLEYSSGFSSERILHEYEVALNTIILPEQEELMEPICNILHSILKIDCSSLTIINRPPSRSKPIYMKVWEARRADGLEYDPEDPEQQYYLAQITKYNITAVK